MTRHKERSAGILRRSEWSKCRSGSLNLKVCTQRLKLTDIEFHGALSLRMKLRVMWRRSTLRLCAVAKPARPEMAVTRTSKRGYWIAAGLLALASYAAHPEAASNGVAGRMIVGYQGWFGCPG